MKRQRHGFTIVELIVVIACIMVLATITIFGYGTWRARTARAEVKNELLNATIALKDTLNFTNAYPATGNLASIYTPKAAVTVTYTLRSGGASYCLVGQSTAVSTVTYYVDSTKGSDPSTTACS